MRYFSLKPIERILKKNGAKRVSKKALAEFSNALSEYADDLAKKSVEMSKHTGRKTVFDSDVRMAVRHE